MPKEKEKKGPSEKTGDVADLHEALEIKGNHNLEGA